MLRTLSSFADIYLRIHGAEKDCNLYFLEAVNHNLERRNVEQIHTYRDRETGRRQQDSSGT
jgi:hypothetical protein